MRRSAHDQQAIRAVCADVVGPGARLYYLFGSRVLRRLARPIRSMELTTSSVPRGLLKPGLTSLKKRPYESYG